MKKTIRYILHLLFLTVMIGAFYLVSKLRLPTGENELVQILIVIVTCWLAWRWVIYDEMSDLREFHKLGPVRYHYHIATHIEDLNIHQNEPTVLHLNGSAKVATHKMAPLPKNKNTNKTMHIPISPVRVGQALMSVGVVFALTTVMLLIGSKTLGQGVLSILYLVPIGWCTVRWGQLAGVSAALTAALSFDYLFIPPYGTFNIGSLEGWLLLFIFFTTAILVVGRIQTILTEERERERKATFLYEMVAAIVNQTTREGIARSIANQTQQKFLAKDVQVHLTAGWGYQTFTTHAGDGQASALGEKPDRALAVVSGPAVIGEIDIWQGVIPLPLEDDPVLQAMLIQTASALERVRVTEGRSPYPKQKPSLSEWDSPQTSHS